VTEFLSLAGTEINGLNPWDIQVLDERFYKRVITQVELGLGESFIGALSLLIYDLREKYVLHWH